MSVDSANRDVANRQKELARLQQEKGRETGRAADASKKAADAMAAASRTSNSATRVSKMRDAVRHQDEAAKHQKKVATLESKISAEQRHLGDAQKKLVSAQGRAQQRQAEDHARSSREQDQRMKDVSRTLARHSHLHSITTAAVVELKSLPERIQVLFLASNPRDQEQLLLDEEVRAIDEMIRKSDHRDAVKLESRWALRPRDLLQALNEVRPRIVHFSGHGSAQDELILQDDHGGSKFISKEAIAQTMAFAADDIQLVFFNTCYSRAQAEAVTHHVPAAIGMNASIGDTAARVFAAQFYSAIGFGHSLGRAFKQARAALLLEGIPEVSTPEMFLAPGVDSDELILVRP